MKMRIKSLISVVVLLFCSSAFAAAQLGRDYKLLSPPQHTSTQKIEVLEFFSYGCSHCFHLHQPLSEWEKNMPSDVELKFVPTMFSSSAEPFARTYFALESMQNFKQMHDAVYRAIHVTGANLYDEETITNFVGSKGVDKAKFLSLYDSFSMQPRIERAKQMIRSYNIEGTPTLVVDGKYAIQATQENGLKPDDLIRVLNEVIALARKAHPAESKPAKAVKAKH